MSGDCIIKIHDRNVLFIAYDQQRHLLDLPDLQHSFKDYATGIVIILVVLREVDEEDHSFAIIEVMFPQSSHMDASAEVPKLHPTPSQLYLFHIEANSGRCAYLPAFQLKKSSGFARPVLSDQDDFSWCLKYPPFGCQISITHALPLPIWIITILVRQLQEEHRNQTDG